jgi:hypothetical protein
VVGSHRGDVGLRRLTGAATGGSARWRWPRVGAAASLAGEPGRVLKRVGWRRSNGPGPKSSLILNIPSLLDFCKIRRGQIKSK